MKTLRHLLALLALVASASAQAPYWQHTNGPFGGNVTKIAEDSTGALYAMADNGIYRSTDNGASWTPVTEIQLGSTFVAFAIARNGHYFASTANDGVYRSTDMGVTWAHMSDGLPQSFAWSIDANPLADEVLVATGPGVYRSTDDGVSWELTGNERIARPVFFTPNGTAYAVVDSGLMRSRDASRAVWEWTDSAIASSAITGMVAFGNDTLWAGSEQNGVFVSTDSGSTWTPRSIPAFTSPSIVAIDRGVGGELFLSTSDAGYLRSTDGGTTWTHLNVGLRQFTAASTLHSRAGRFFVASTKGLFMIDDPVADAVWLPSRTGFLNSVVRSVIVADDGDLYALQFTGIFHRSTDGGANWSIVDLNIPPNTDATAMAMDSSGGLVIAVRGVGLYRSTDRGSTWTAYSAGLPTIRPTAMAIDSLGRFYLGSDQGMLYRTVDAGATWDSTEMARGPGSAINAIAARGETVFAGSQQNLFVSYAGGRNFTNVPTLVRTYSVAITPEHHVYVGSFTGRVYRSTDDGLSWDYSTTKPSAPIVAAVGVNARGDVFAGDQPGGMWISRDGAVTWTPIQSGLINPAITSIAFDATGVAYIGTYGGGVHRSVESTTGIAVERVAEGASMSIAPSPARDHATIALDVRRAANVRIEIFDAIGARVALVTDEPVSAGTRRFTVDASRLAPGAYRCRTIVGDEAISAPLVVTR
jgi:photosystem II stability/assembly factor-like uncharacterized protein